MDPNTVLYKLRDLTEKIEQTGFLDEEDAVEMAELFLGLDDWLVKGGFLPKEWDPLSRKWNDTYGLP